MAGTDRNVGTMKRHRLSMGLTLLSLMTLFMACGTDEVGQTTGTPPSSGPTSDVEMVSYTHAVPDGYDQEAEERGSVVRIDYDTRDYAEGSGAARANTAYVYLPYGYSENQRYNILYFVHGHYSTAASTFEDGNGVVRKLLDQMIAHGDIDPMIVVTPSYNYGQPTASYADADPYCRALPQELVNDLIPVVESRYRTYAGTGFYIWAASGTNDSAYSEIWLQIEGMAQLENVFNTSNMTFHLKEGARHEFRPIPEYLYNALPFFFPKK